MDTSIHPAQAAACAQEVSQNPAPALLTVQQTMQRLNCARSRLYELFACGRLPRVKFGSRTLVPTQAVDGLIQELVSEAETDAATRRAGRGA